MKLLSQMSRDERSLLLYLETRAVDHGGLVDVRHMNKEDFKIADIWNIDEFIMFDRIVYRDIVNKYECYGVRLTDNAWKLVHQERKERAERMWLKRNWLTTNENIEINGIAKVRMGLAGKE